MEDIALNQYYACKAELLELARNQVRLPRPGCAVADTVQLDVFGIRMGFLPSQLPFSMSLSSFPVTPDEARRESRTISNPELLKCLGDRPAFYDLYIKLTNRAIDAYVKAGRRKFALRLHGSLAALDVLVMVLVPLTSSHESYFQSPRSINLCPSNIFLATSSLRATPMDIIGVLHAFTGNRRILPCEHCERQTMGQHCSRIP